MDVKAEDYTMAQSSVVYYQDKDSGQWVEFQKVHGRENRGPGGHQRNVSLPVAGGGVY